MEEHSPTPWRVENINQTWHVDAADDSFVALFVREADARLIVEAVNATGAWREERRRLELAAASAEMAFVNADARRTLLERYYCEVYADRDRLRDLVRRLVHQFSGRATYDDDAALLREALEAIGEDTP